MPHRRLARRSAWAASHGVLHGRAGRCAADHRRVARGARAARRRRDARVRRHGQGRRAAARRRCVRGRAREREVFGNGRASERGPRRRRPRARLGGARGARGRRVGFRSLRGALRGALPLLMPQRAPCAPPASAASNALGFEGFGRRRRARPPPAWVAAGASLRLRLPRSEPVAKLSSVLSRHDGLRARAEQPRHRARPYDARGVQPARDVRFDASALERDTAMALTLCVLIRTRARRVYARASPRRHVLLALPARHHRPSTRRRPARAVQSARPRSSAAPCPTAAS